MGCGASSEKGAGGTDVAPTVPPSSPILAGGQAQATKSKQAASNDATTASTASGATPAAAAAAAGTAPTAAAAAAAAPGAAAAAQPVAASAAPAGTAAAAAAAAAVGSNPVAIKGLTLRGIRHLATRIQQLCSEGFFKDPWDLHGEQQPGAEGYEDLTTAQLAVKWVKAEVNAKGGSALVDALAAALPDVPVAERAQLAAAPSYYVSHVWSGRAFRLFDTIEAFLAGASDATAVWLDITAIDQRHVDSKTDDAALQALLVGCHGALRACHGGVLAVVDLCSDDRNPASRAWCMYEWEQCTAVHGSGRLHLHGVSAQDRERIISAINQEQAKIGGAAGADMLRVMHADIVRQYGTLAAFDRQLKLQLLLEPLSYKVDLEQLAKRTQAVQWRWEAVRPFFEGEQTGRAYGLLAGAGTGKSCAVAAMCQQLLSRRDPNNPGQWLGPISAVHFVRYDDQRRLDPVCAVMSLVYQLAVRSDAVAELVLKHSPQVVAGLRSMEEAFEALLLPAVESIAVPVVLVVDGLDEADPPGQQQAQAEQQLRQLQQEAQQQQQREGAEEQQQQQQAGAGAGAAQQLAGLGAVKVCGNAMLRLVVSLFAKKLPEQARLVLSSRPEGCCGGMQEVLTRAFPHMKFLEPDALFAADVTSPMVLYDAMARECGVDVPLPEDGVPTLASVHAAYRVLFDRAPPGAKPSELLQLLLAVQEPLSCQLLQQLGYDAAVLQQLPGWGRLFFEAGQHVHLLHRSLRDWLGTDRAANPHAPDVAAGHRALGAHLLKDVCRASPAYQPPEYCLKYAYLHLCEAGPDAADLLEHALAQWDFIRAGFAAGHGARLVSALGSAAWVLRGQASGYAYDAYRWLSRLSGAFERQPEALEELTLVRASGCPMLSAKFQEAAKGRSCQWTPRLQLGGSGGAWTADVATFKGNGAKVNAVVYSPDASQVVAACDDGALYVWDVASGSLVATLRGHTKGVLCATFDRSGRKLITGSRDNTVKVWDVASGTLATSMSGHQGAVTAVVFSPNNGVLATGSEDTSTRLWDLNATGNRCLSVIQGSSIVTSLAFNFSGKQLAIGSEDGVARVWDLTLDTFMLTLPGHKDWITSVAFSATHLAVGSRDGSAKVWDLDTATCNATLAGHGGGGVLDVAVLPTGQVLTAGGDGLVRMWDAGAGGGVCIATLAGHSDKVSSLAVAGERLATGSHDGSVRIWDLASASGGLGTGEGHGGAVTCIDVSPDGRLIATGSTDHTVRLWDAASGACTAVLQGHADDVTSVCFHAAGKPWLASGSRDYTACVWELSAAGGTCVATLQEHTDAVLSVAFSPSDDCLATASQDSTAKVWDLKLGPGAVTSAVTLQSASPLLSIAFSPSGKQLVSGSEAGVVALWDAAKGACLVELPGHEARVCAVAFSPDGRQVASGAADATARVWDIALPGGGIGTTALPAHSDVVWSVAYSPDGRQLTLGADDGLCSVWDPYNAIPIAAFGAHDGPVTAVAYSRNGCVLAMASADGTATVWADVAREAFMASLVPVQPSVWIAATATSADANRLAIAWSDLTVQVWDNIGRSDRKCVATLGPLKAEVHSMAFSMDHARLLLGNKDNTASVWDLTGAGAGLEPAAVFKGHKNWVTAVAFSFDGELVATGSADGTVRVWSFPADGACIAALSGHRHTVVAVAFSPNNRCLASGSSDATARLWSIPGGQSVATLTGHSKAVTCLAWNPPGTQLSTGSEDLTVQLWDLGGAEPGAAPAAPTREAFLGHKSGVKGIAYSRDGKLLASIEDKTLRVWDLATATCIKPLVGHTDRVRGLAFSGDGKQLLSVGWDNTLLLWPMANVRSKGERPSLSISITPDKQLVKVDAKAGAKA